jgi:hypothetical protein
MFSRSLQRLAAVVAVMIALASALPVDTFAQGSRYSLGLHNTSGFTIYRVFMASSDDEIWFDQLGEKVLPSGNTHTITDIPAGEYDFKFVDTDGDTCELHKVHIFSSKTWKLTKDWLLDCEFPNRTSGTGTSATNPTSTTRR